MTGGRDWRQERNRLIKGIKLVSQLNELSEGEEGMTEGALTLEELVFKQTKRQEKKRKLREMKKHSVESSQNSTLSHIKLTNLQTVTPVLSMGGRRSSGPRLSVFILSKEGGGEEPGKRKDTGRDTGRDSPLGGKRQTLMTGEKAGGGEAAQSKVEAHFGVIKKRLLQLNKEKFYSLLQSLPKNKPPTQSMVNKALDKIEGGGNAGDSELNLTTGGPVVAKTGVIKKRLVS